MLKPNVAPELGCAPPMCSERDIVPARHQWSFHIVYPPTPATSCAKPPLIIAPAEGAADTLLPTYGDPQAGVGFQRSSTLGLLFSVIPYVTALSNNSPPWLA